MIKPKILGYTPINYWGDNEDHRLVEYFTELSASNSSTDLNKAKVFTNKCDLDYRIWKFVSSENKYWEFFLMTAKEEK